jgi:hypothetical protein
VEGFTLEGPRRGDWRVPAGLLAAAGFGFALVALYGGGPPLLWPLPLVLLAAESLRRWHGSPRARLVVDANGVRYGFDGESVLTPWPSIHALEKRDVSGRPMVFLVEPGGDALPLDPEALGVGADELVALLDGCRRAAQSPPGAP